MKFKIKLFIITIMVVSAGFCAGGALLVAQNFRSSLHSQIGRSTAEHHTLKYSYDALLSAEILMGQELNNDLAVQSAALIAEMYSWNALVLCVSDSDKNHIFSNLPQDIGRLDVLDTLQTDPHYKIVRKDGLYYIIMSSMSTLKDTSHYLTSASDISAVYAELASQLRNMIVTNVALLAVLGLILFILSDIITRPIDKLGKAAGRIASGNYGERVEVRGDDEIAVLSEQFNLMADSVEQNILRLEEYAKSRDDFVTNFSHEMKTPMTSIIGYADLLRSKKSDEETIAECAEYVWSEGRRLEALSRRLLTLMKIRQTALALSAHELSPVLDEVAGSTRPVCAKKNISVAISAYPKRAVFDPPLLKMLLINLVQNACAACSRNGKIQIDFAEQDGKCRVSVTDNGCGIAEDEIGHITEEFYRVDKSRKNTGGNVGLGLAICKEIARLHGSELVITSTAGKGTTVSFYLERSDVTLVP